MTPYTESLKKSYDRHEKNYQKYTTGEKLAKHAKSWQRDDTLAAHRVHKLYELTDPFLKEKNNDQKDISFLTVGDGRYGLDAQYLAKKGAQATATDISDALLSEAYQQGQIHHYSKENAEKLSFQDHSFDYVYCKEAYHHFPRPYMALYEMLRVAKKGAILLEPFDRNICPWYFQIGLGFKNLFKKILKKPVHHHHFEEDDANYLYSLSKEEMIKVALGLGYKYVIFKGINDIYLEGMEYAPMEKKNSYYKKWKQKQNLYDFFCKIKIIPYNLLFTAILKESPSKTLLDTLKNQHYEIIQLPENPYY